MDTIRFNYLIMSLLLTPFVVFAAYIAWLVVPVVVREGGTRSRSRCDQYIKLIRSLKSRNATHEGWRLY
jgi:hypothetical protein